MLETLRLIQFKAAYNLPVHAGIEAGIFARYGLALEIAYTPGSLYTSAALREGRYDIGHTGADDIIGDVEQDSGSDLFIFMGLHSGLFSLVAGKDGAALDSLAGRRIGVDATDSGFALVLERFLRSRGILGDTYQPVQVGGWERRYAALVAGEISATLLTEPFIGRALAQGCHLVARDCDMIASYQGTCGAASRRWARHHPERLVSYIRAYLEATRWCFDESNRRACLEILSRSNAIDEAAAESTLGALLDPEHGLYRDAAVNMAGINSALDVRADLGYLSRPTPAVQKYLDLSYYGKALSLQR